jgi:hypothetical protein
MNSCFDEALRSFRGQLYRILPPFRAGFFRKKLGGFERRWNLEKMGFTKEGFFQVFCDRFELPKAPGLLLELAGGDGLVGSLGLWMEIGACGWKTEVWEHRPYVYEQLRKNRPNTEVHKGRLTDWMGDFSGNTPTAITTRGAREASGVCRGIRNKLIRPDWLGIWNPSRRPVWFRRLNKQGYRLELVWQNIEFYRCRHP